MRFLPFLGLLLCAACQENAVPAETRAEKQTLQEILAARPAPDLTQLVARCSPDLRSPDSTESFRDLLKLREIGDPKTVPVLEKVLVENLPTTRIHGFAATQALFCIGTPEAHKILARHLSAEGFHAELAIMYTSHWEMPEPRRSRFIEQYLLKNLSRSLVVKVEQVPLPKSASPEPPKGRLDMVVILRNASQDTFHILDRRDFPGELLYLRDARGQFIPRIRHRSACLGPPKYIELKPGQTHRVKVTIELAGVKIGDQVREASARLTAEVQESGHRFEISSPGRFQLLAMFEAAPLTEEQRKYLKVDETWKWWTGRSVSDPVAVDLTLPSAPEFPSPK